MNRKIILALLFFISLLCFSALAWLHFNVPSQAVNLKSQQKELSLITSRIDSALAHAHQSAVIIGNQLANDTVSFSRLLKQTHYPSFVYRQDTLVFWSDHTIIPDLDFPPDVIKPAIVNNSYGVFIVVPHQVKAYKILIYIPLQVNYQISNSYLTSGLQENIFGNVQASLVLEPVKGLPQIKSPAGEFLFALEFAEVKTHAVSNNLLLALFIFGSLLFIVFSIACARTLFKKGKYTLGVVLLLILLGGFRLALLFLNLPFALVELNLFDPSLYAASFWSPSIGDLALNMLLLLVVAWAILYLFKKQNVLAELKGITVKNSRLLQAGCFAIFYMLLFLLFGFYHGIYHNSPLVLDITQSLDLSKYKIVILGVMFLHTIVLGIFCYILVSIISFLLKKEQFSWPYKLLAGIAILLLLVFVFFAKELLLLVLGGTIFWLVVIISAQYRQEVSFPYRTYFFVFLIITVSAFTGSIALFEHYQNEVKVYKQKFAFNLLQDNDVLGEYLLEDVAKKIAKDALIQAKMKGPYVDAAFIKLKISKQYLRHYFDKYETNVFLYDSEGRTLESSDTTATSLQELKSKYDTPATRTERKNLFLVKDPGRYNARTYFKLIEIPISTRQKGTIVLQLSLKRLLPNSVVPELLVDQKQDQHFRIDMLSYAIYDGKQLKYSEGEYDYATNMDPVHIDHAEFYRDGHNQGDYHHFGVKDEDGKVLVVTTKKYGASEILSNFSFLFLVFTAGLILLAILILVFRRSYIREFRPNFSTKIQLFLNFGILLPLLLVSITTAGLVTASYKRDLMMSYERRGEAIQENMATALANGILQRQLWLQRRIVDVAAISEADVNLYDRNGRLLVTSQPLIFEAGLLSKLVNPEAIAAISERQALRVLLEEQAGSLKFNALYLPLRNEAAAGELVGYIGIPFFDSEKQLDLKLIELITTTMNIFTVMFIVFIVLTFFASRALTVPLRLLADKLKRTSLTGKNEMLAYASADEIGMLVNEYNRMLLTLEKNKEELATKEKEAAWREMARQVAHEIKNPLTPMKLSLQYLQKAIAEKKPNTEQLIDKISHTLITQINILSDIATSFSDFTTMPEPKAELIDVAAALRKSSDLHNDPATATLISKIPNEQVMVMADENLLVRTFNNLLLNAIQAVPASRKPKLLVMLQVEQDKTVVISIKDNGSGIPAEIQQKVFIPNFSTKYTGSGIGLAVAKKGIETAGGQIWFETEEGKGTTFFISLPLAAP
ncbi:sensor histidine kinase [Pontibacter vulgaris]|uniref:sensor histidine kinase n=1 Tax=Pontibacter vulgaris TaxID=2905679 RepID=UPI001FA71B44|nr:HAMP domain-containing sensor histidine kinase [Pontibacter vulgaris]